MLLSTSELRPSVDEIAIIVSRAMGLSFESVYSSSRKPAVVDARRIIVIIGRELGYSLQAIGQSMGRHYSSIIHLERTYKDLFDTDLTFRAHALHALKAFNLIIQLSKSEERMDNSKLTFAPEPELWPEEWTDAFSFDLQQLEKDRASIEDAINAASERADNPPHAFALGHVFTSHQVLVDELKDQLYGAEIPFRHIHIPEYYG